MRKKIAFIGVGNMATAIINGLISNKNENSIDISDIVLFDKNHLQTEGFAEMGALTASSVEDAASKADCIMLCVKPQNFEEVLPSLAKVENASEKLYITIAAGIKTDAVSDAIGGAAVVRVLPNTPIFIGKGVSAICKNKYVTDSDFIFACGIFSLSSRVITIDENEMNRIISVTSSSPAYVFLLIKSMLDGAVSQGLLKSEGSLHGLEQKELIDCICDTIIGSAELMKSSVKTPDEQIKTVASKGGTTERALSVLADYEFSKAVVLAMEKCTERADELGK